MELTEEELVELLDGMIADIHVAAERLEYCINAIDCMGEACREVPHAFA